MIARFPYAGLILFWLACCGAPADSSQGAVGSAPADSGREVARSAQATMRVVYAHERTSRAHVYDLATMRIGVRSKANPDRPSEFGSPLSSCSTASIHCLDAGLLFAVPRVFPFPPAWSAGDYSCRLLPATTQPPEGVIHAECRSRKDYPTVFDYSKDRGILRYRRLCPDCSEGYFVLVGAKGLFAAP